MPRRCCFVGAGFQPAHLSPVGNSPHEGRRPTDGPVSRANGGHEARGGRPANAPPPTVTRRCGPVGGTPPPPLGRPGARTEQVESVPDPAPPPAGRPDLMDPGNGRPAARVGPGNAAGVSRLAGKAADKAEAEP